MLETRRSYGGMVSAPRHLAAQAGVEVLRDGGNAIEAMIAAAMSGRIGPRCGPETSCVLRRQQVPAMERLPWIPLSLPS